MIQPTIHICYYTMTYSNTMSYAIIVHHISLSLALSLALSLSLIYVYIYMYRVTVYISCPNTMIGQHGDVPEGSRRLPAAPDGS